MCSEPMTTFYWTSVFRRLAIGQSAAVNLGRHTPVCIPAFSFSLGFSRWRFKPGRGLLPAHPIGYKKPKGHSKGGDTTRSWLLEGHPSSICHDHAGRGLCRPVPEPAGRRRPLKHTDSGSRLSERLISGGSSQARAQCFP